ncbi:MAG: 30S ribosome-binding factor RbfA [Desulfobulbaceae bacterium]|nr:30S ribosome-binding factor RbfA [Desulfobulbaceae bacterium]
MAAKKGKAGFLLPAGLRPEPKRRPIRVGDLIRNEIAMLLLFKIKDPRLLYVTITEVVMTDDLRRARIYFVCDEKLVKKSEKGLVSAKGFIRSHLARVLNMRYVPELLFLYDPAHAKRERMDQLFQEIAGENGTTTD